MASPLRQGEDCEEGPTPRKRPTPWPQPEPWPPQGAHGPTPSQRCTHSQPVGPPSPHPHPTPAHRTTLPHRLQSRACQGGGAARPRLHPEMPPTLSSEGDSPCHAPRATALSSVSCLWSQEEPGTTNDPAPSVWKIQHSRWEKPPGAGAGAKGRLLRTPWPQRIPAALLQGYGGRQPGLGRPRSRWLQQEPV